MYENNGYFKIKYINTSDIWLQVRYNEAVIKMNTPDTLLENRACTFKTHHYPFNDNC